MIAHTTLPVSDYKKSKIFYKKVLAELGYKNNMEVENSGGYNDGKNTDFWISYKDKVEPTHIAFEARNRKEVEDFYKTALEAGGIDNGPPDYRDYSPGYYAAFILDPDGHNIEAVWYDYKKQN